MTTCTKITGRRRRACIGAMDQRITLQDRDILPPAFGTVDFDEGFSGDNEVWAGVKTVHGKTFFDGVNERDINVTHEVVIRYDATVTAETWIQLADGRRLDILDTADLDERHEYLLLRCTDKGASKL